jgi:hypothetical protein
MSLKGCWREGYVRAELWGCFFVRATVETQGGRAELRMGAGFVIDDEVTGTRVGR